LLAITRPVALAVFAAAAISKICPIQLVGNALILSAVAFLPLVRVYYPKVSLQELTITTLLATFGYVVALVIAMLGLMAGHIGYFRQSLSLSERAILISAGATIISPYWSIILLGVLTIILILALRF
jgi:TRAP-type uncharacterized transport system fused permease subunit